MRKHILSGHINDNIGIHNNNNNSNNNNEVNYDNSE
jgi:hypothetical protein